MSEMFLETEGVGSGCFSLKRRRDDGLSVASAVKHRSYEDVQTHI